MNRELQESDAEQGRMLSLTIKDRATLHATYMPFLRNGGIFLPTTRRSEIGNPVFLLLALPDSSERLAVNGRVAWITPAHAQGNRAPGIGIQFLDADGTAHRRIERVLGEHLNSDTLTHTM